MSWKEQLKKLETAKEWDMAIEFMQKVVAEHPNDVDAYLGINFLLMNLLVEEDYNEDKHDYYAQLTKHYFKESYAKFSGNPEYLFYTGITAYMSEWYFGIEQEDAKKMLFDAMRLDPENLLYKDTYYIYLDIKDPKNKKAVYDYAQIILAKDSPIKKALLLKGSLGEYILGMMINWGYNLVHGRPITLEELAQFLKP